MNRARNTPLRDSYISKFPKIYSSEEVVPLLQQWGEIWRQ